jgi:integrase
MPRRAQGTTFVSDGAVYASVTIAPRKRLARALQGIVALEDEPGAKAWAATLQELVDALRGAGRGAELVEKVDVALQVGRDDAAGGLERVRASVSKLRAANGEVQIAAATPAAKRAGARSVAKHTETWLKYCASLYDERTHGSLRQNAARWPSFIATEIDAIDGPAIARLMSARLKKVTRKTLRKEFWALRAFLTWLVDVAGLLDAVPTFPKVPKRATGVRSGRQREKVVELSQPQVREILVALTDRARPRYTLMAETGLRPETIDSLSVPEHYKRGAKQLHITPDIDKNRFGRDLPLSPGARAVLDSVAGKSGLIFERTARGNSKRYIEDFKAAVEACGLPKETAPYDLRHALGTHAVEASGGNLTGVAFLLGHLQVTTTNRYVHSSERSAEDVLASIARGSARVAQGAKRKAAG